MIRSNCKNCGAPLDYKKFFCLYCGSQFQTAPAASEPGAKVAIETASEGLKKMSNDCGVSQETLIVAGAAAFLMMMKR